VLRPWDGLWLRDIEMRTKKFVITGRERAKRSRETARETGTDHDLAPFERAFAAVVRGSQKPQKPDPKKK
jgi:hypothetical protein